MNIFIMFYYMKRLAMKCFWFTLVYPSMATFFTILVNFSSILKSINENINIIVVPFHTNTEVLCKLFDMVYIYILCQNDSFLMCWIKYK